MDNLTLALIFISTFVLQSYIRKTGAFYPHKPGTVKVESGQAGKTETPLQEGEVKPLSERAISRPPPRGFLSFSRDESLELAAAWVILSVAFGILYSDRSIENFKIALPICLATVGLGFILHEMGHKYLAQRYGFDAVFKANYPGLGGAIALSFFGFVLVTPGAVYIRDGLTKEQNGKISLLGPLMNVLLGAGFLALYLSRLSDAWIVSITAWLGYKINTWIGLFNLIPSPSFDGSKIKEWNLPVYIVLVILIGGMYLLSYTSILQDYKSGMDKSGECVALLDDGEYEKALKACDDALRSDPENPVTWSNKAAVLEGLGEAEQALQSYDKSIELDSKLPITWNNRAKLLYKLGRYDAALESLDKAIELNRSDGYFWYGRGLILIELHRYEEAVDAFDIASSIYPNDQDIWFYKAYALGELGRYSESLTAYDTALELDPLFATGWNNKCFTLNKLGRYMEAMQACNKSLELEPNSPYTWGHMGAAFQNLTMYEEALTAFNKATELNSNLTEVWYQKGILLKRLGREEEAQAAFKRVRELNSTYTLSAGY